MIPTEFLFSLFDLYDYLIASLITAVNDVFFFQKKDPYSCIHLEVK